MSWDIVSETRRDDYEIVRTMVEKGVSIGASSVVKCGITIGEHAFIGAGSVVVEDVPEKTVVYGSKAEVRKRLR